MGYMQIDGIAYAIPQELDLIGSLDERSETYRISLGLVDPTDEQKQQYQSLFSVIDKQTRGLFIDTVVTFTEGLQQLEMKLATVDRHVHTFGTFYELESNIADTVIQTIKEGTNDIHRRTGATKNKKVNGKRKATDKRDRRISRT